MPFVVVCPDAEHHFLHIYRYNLHIHAPSLEQLPGVVHFWVSLQAPRRSELFQTWGSAWSLVWQSPPGAADAR